MNPFAVTKNPKISRITVAALEEFGYKVDYSQADAYPYADLGDLCKCKDRRRRLGYSVSGGVLSQEESPATMVQGQHHHHHRQLSEAAIAKATDYGRKILAASPSPELFEGRLTEPESDLEYVGGKNIEVYIKEDDAIFFVSVDAE